jgi:hypothetical protein
LCCKVLRMIEQQTRLRAYEWLLTAAVALIGSIILFDRNAGINWAIWVALAVIVTLLCRRSADTAPAAPQLMLGVAAMIAAGAAARTTDINVHVGIFWLTALLLAAFLSSILVADWEEIGLFRLLTSPFRSAARVVTSTLREAGLGLRAATDSPSRPLLRRIVIVAPVVIVLFILLGGADPVIDSVIHNIGIWLPTITISARSVFFVFLLVVMVGACSRLPELKVAIPTLQPQFRNGPTGKDGIILVASTLATLLVFLILQTIYLFVQPPSEIGNGVTYAEYARRGFGQLCVVVTIVAAVILFAERFRDKEDIARLRTLRILEFAAIAAAGLILLSALRRVILYEQAYGYTLARVHATAYIVFIAALLILLALELNRGRITQTLGRRSAAFALAVVLVILYWNDQAWIANRNIDRIHATGKFDANYAASLSLDAFPALASRKDELAPADWATIRDRAVCKSIIGPFQWYEWNPLRSAAKTAKDALHLPGSSNCPRPRD